MGECIIPVLQQGIHPVMASMVGKIVEGSVGLSSVLFVRKATTELMKKGVSPVKSASSLN